MAKCERLIPEPVSPPPSYRLELTADEHAALCSLLGWHSGGPEGVIYRIYTALSGAGTPGRRLKIEGDCPRIAEWRA